MVASTNSFGSGATAGQGQFPTRSSGSPRSRAESLPYNLKVLLENLLRTEDGANITTDHIRALGGWDENAEPDTEIQFTPPASSLRDFTTASVRRRPRHHAGGRRRPRRRPEDQPAGPPAELVIDHSVQIDVFGRADAFERNVEFGMRPNKERWFLRWGQTAFDDFKVVPPGTGIVHQVNIERLAPASRWCGDGVAYPDTCVGTDLPPTMVNGLGVLGWGVRRHRGRGGHARPAGLDAHPAGLSVSS